MRRFKVGDEARYIGEEVRIGGLVARPNDIFLIRYVSRAAPPNDFYTVRQGKDGRDFIIHGKDKFVPIYSWRKL